MSNSYKVNYQHLGALGKLNLKDGPCESAYNVIRALSQLPSEVWHIGIYMEFQYATWQATIGSH